MKRLFVLRVFLIGWALAFREPVVGLARGGAEATSQSRQPRRPWLACWRCCQRPCGAHDRGGRGLDGAYVVVNLGRAVLLIRRYSFSLKMVAAL